MYRKIPLPSPFFKGGTLIPLFVKEGLGEIFLRHIRIATQSPRGKAGIRGSEYFPRKPGRESESERVVDGVLIINKTPSVLSLVW
jgi:hypothetical protein